MTLPETTTPAPARLWVQILLGGALGLCVGTLMGMTTAPVVGTVIGALAALFATIFGVKDQDLSSFGRIGGFGMFCVLGVLGGIYVRTHNSLGISAGQQVAEWTAAGFDDDVARSIVLYKELGVLATPGGALTTTSRAEKIVPQPLLTASSLSSRSASECASMAPSQFGGDAARVIQSYRAAGGEWETFADAIAALTPVEQSKIIPVAYNLACGTAK